MAKAMIQAIMSPPADTGTGQGKLRVDMLWSPLRPLVVDKLLLYFYDDSDCCVARHNNWKCRSYQEDCKAQCRFEVTESRMLKRRLRNVSRHVNAVKSLQELVQDVYLT